MPTKTQAKKATTTKPTFGQLTQDQAGEPSVIGGALGGFGPVAAGTYPTYRRMRETPTIALARAVFHAPIKAAKWSYQQGDAPTEDMLTFIKDMLDPMRAWIMHNMLYAMDYGHTDMEMVWAVREGKIVLDKAKPLLVEKTDLLIDPHGGFAGVKQGKLALPPEKVLHWAYDMEAGNLHGRSWYENCRIVWSAWKDTWGQLGQYTRKVAGTVVLLRYPAGDSKGETGDTKANKDHATTILAGLKGGGSVALPVRLYKWAQQLLRAGVDVSKLISWQFDTLEPKLAHGQDFVTTLQHMERQLTRALLVPERAILEGTHGTKAEAEAHGTISQQVGQQVLDNIIQELNTSVVDRLLVWNWGEQARGLVRIEAEPLVDSSKAFLRTLFLRALLSPQSWEALWDAADLDASLEMLGLPKLQERVTPEGIGPSPEATPEEERDQVMTAALARMVGDLARRRRNGGNGPG